MLITKGESITKLKVLLVLLSRQQTGGRMGSVMSLAMIEVLLALTKPRPGGFVGFVKANKT